MEQREKGGGGSSKPSAMSKKAKPMQVKHIVTQTVSTDEAHFKSVVQRLTGKDAVETLWESKVAVSTARSASADEEGEKRKEELEDALMGELPSVEELKQWWSD